MILDEEKLSDSKKAIRLKSAAMKRRGIKPVNPDRAGELTIQMNERSIASRKSLNSKKEVVMVGPKVQ